MDLPLTDLHTASAYGYQFTVRVHAQEGADLNARSAEGETPLWLACANNRFESVRFLLWSGADVHLPNAHGRPPIWAAACGGHTAVVLLLLRHGASLSAPTEHLLPIWIAAFMGHTSTVRALLDHGASPFVSGAVGEAAAVLHRAAKQAQLHALARGRHCPESPLFRADELVLRRIAAYL